MNQDEIDRRYDEVSALTKKIQPLLIGQPIGAILFVATDLIAQAASRLDAESRNKIIEALPYTVRALMRLAPRASGASTPQKPPGLSS